MKLTILAAVAVLLPASTWAADIFDIKPGLWENSSTTETTGLPAMPQGMPQLTADQLAKIPPAQRAQIEAMMKGAAGGPHTNVMKVCITREMLAKALSMGQQNNCTTKVTSLSASKQEFHVECTGQTKMTGDGIVERVDPEHTKYNMLLKSEGDHPMTIKVNSTGKFLSSDCGDVKPPSMDK